MKTIILLPHEVEQIQSTSKLTLIRWVDPQPEGLTWYDILEDHALSNEIVLPSIEELLGKCPYGKAGDQLVGLAPELLFKLKIKTVKILRFSEIDEKIAYATGIKPCIETVIVKGLEVAFGAELMATLPPTQLYLGNIWWVWVLNLETIVQK